MRTKTLLLTAALGLAGLATSMAQVYSVNAVGFVNKNVPAGFSIQANPLNAATNSVGALFTTGVPEGTTLYFFRSGSYVIATYAQDDFGNLVWDQPDLQVAPGEGFWILNPGAAFTQTWVGEVPQGTGANALVNPVPAGFSLKSSVVPQEGALSSALGYPASENDVIYLYRNGSYQISSFVQDDFGNLAWDVEPAPQVGEGFWVLTSAAKNWTRSFSVN